MNSLNFLDEYDAVNDSKSGSNGNRRYTTLRRRNSRDLLNTEAPLKSTPPAMSNIPSSIATNADALCHDAHLKSRYLFYILFLD
jgi:hypothetical protein